MMDDNNPIFEKIYLGKDTHQTLESIYHWMMGLLVILIFFFSNSLYFLISSTMNTV